MSLAFKNIVVKLSMTFLRKSDVGRIYTVNRKSLGSVAQRNLGGT